MQQFDVCRLKERGEQLVMIVQNDAADELATRVVAPLSDRPYQRLIERIRIPVEFQGGSYVLQLDRMAAIERRLIGNVVGTLAAEEVRVKSGLDFLFFGV
ncbi:MAG: CcdB family protein [Bauldia sp.]|nr:CcdB family protein [Bauldia sp.]